MPAEPTDAGIVPYGVRRVDTSSARPSGGHLPLRQNDSARSSRTASGTELTGKEERGSG